MRYGIFSDVHSNWEAMNAALEMLAELKIDQYVFVGDIVGYGADAVACLRLLKRLVLEKGCLCVAGNHDYAVSGVCRHENFNKYAQVAVEWTKTQLPAADLQFLSQLSLVGHTEHFVFVHSNLQSPSAWDYVLDLADALPNFPLMDRPVCFVGHSHRPAVFESGVGLHQLWAEDIIIEPKKKYLINIGSVGQPRDGDPRACFAVYDTEKSLVSIKRVYYDFQKTQEKIIATGLPLFLAQRLKNGI